eukprot:gene1424-2735_t
MISRVVVSLIIFVINLSFADGWQCHRNVKNSKLIGGLKADFRFSLDAIVDSRIDFDYGRSQEKKVKSTADAKQMEAIVSAKCSTLVVAGAGSGKTRVLSSRLAHLLSQGSCSPSEVLILSFTNEAANHLRARTERLLNGSVATASGVWCDTFHGLCSKILGDHMASLSLRKDFVIADEGDQLRIITNIIEEKGASTPHRSTALNILKEIRQWKEQGLGYLGVRKKSLKTTAAITAYDIYPEYQKRLRAVSALDLGDLLLYTLRLFREDPKVLTHWRDKLRHILVDEFQDVSPAQYDILRLLSTGPYITTTTSQNTPSDDSIQISDSILSTKSSNMPSTTSSTPSSSLSTDKTIDRLIQFKETLTSFALGQQSQSSSSSSPKSTTSSRRVVNVFCVGDDDQTIYAWRGAHVDLMRKFRFDFPDAEVLRFDTTYRIPETICRAASSLLSGITDRIPKTLNSLSEYAIGTGSGGDSFADSLHSKSTTTTEVKLEVPVPVSSSSSSSLLSPLKSACGAVLGFASKLITRASLEVRQAATEKIELAWLSAYLASRTTSSPSSPSTPPLSSSSSSTSDNTNNIGLIPISPKTLSRYSVAVLARSRSDVKKITTELKRRNVPFRTRGYATWVMPASGASPLNLLRLLASPSHDLAFQSALDNDIILSVLGTSKGLSIKNVLPIIRECATSRSLSLMDATRECILQKKLPEPYSKALTLFIQKYDAWSADVNRYFKRGDSARKVVYDVLRSAYNLRWNEPCISAAADDISRSAEAFDSFEKFMSAIRLEGDYIIEDTLSSPEEMELVDGYICEEIDTELDDTDMPDMRAYRAAASATANNELLLQNQTIKQGNAIGSGNGVVPVNVWVMTMHAAKGIEFDEVLLPFWTESKMGKTSPEERRVAYVSLTRARERVMISYSADGSSNSNGNINSRSTPAGISPFLEKLMQEDKSIQVQYINEDDIAKMVAVAVTADVPSNLTITSATATTIVKPATKKRTKTQTKSTSTTPELKTKTKSKSKPKPSKEIIQFENIAKNLNSFDINELLGGSIISRLNMKFNKGDMKILFKAALAMRGFARGRIPVQSDGIRNEYDLEKGTKPLSDCSLPELASHLMTLL